MRQVIAHYEGAVLIPLEFAHCPLYRGALVGRYSGGKLRPACMSCGSVQYRSPAPSVSTLLVDGNRVLLGRRKEEPDRGSLRFESEQGEDKWAVAGVPLVEHDVERIR